MGWQSDGQSCRGLNLVGDDPKDFYKVLGVDYDATEDSIRSNYLRLALKWHPDKHSGEPAATLKFQKINEAYRVLSDPTKRQDYDMNGDFVQDYSISEYLNRFKGLILTCNGLGISNLSVSDQLEAIEKEKSTTAIGVHRIQLDSICSNVEQEELESKMGIHKLLADYIFVNVLQAFHVL